MVEIDLMVRSMGPVSEIEMVCSGLTPLEVVMNFIFMTSEASVFFDIYLLILGP